MANKPSPPAGDDDRRIADAELLFRDNAAGRPQPDAPRSPEASPGDDYALEERGEPVRKKIEPFLDEAPILRPVVNARGVGEVPGRGKNSSPVAGHGRSSMTRTPSSRSGPGARNGDGPWRSWRPSW